MKKINPSRFSLWTFGPHCVCENTYKARTLYVCTSNCMFFIHKAKCELHWDHLDFTINHSNGPQTNSSQTTFGEFALVCLWVIFEGLDSFVVFACAQKSWSIDLKPLGALKQTKCEHIHYVNFSSTEPYNIKVTICVFPWLKDVWYSTGLMQVILKRFCRKIFMFAETQRKISLQESNIWHNPKHETRTKC